MATDDCEVVTTVRPRTRRGLTKRNLQLSVDNDSFSTETSIYTSKVHNLWNRSSCDAKANANSKKLTKANDTNKEWASKDQKDKNSSCHIPQEKSEVNLGEIKDPTPPSTPKAKTRKTTRRNLKKGVESAIKKLQDMQKATSQIDDEVVIVDDDCPLQCSDNQSLVIKVRLPSGVKKFHMQQTESFAKVFASIAATENVDENNIFMFFNDMTVHIYDSPKGLGLTIADILECHIGQQQLSLATNSTVDDRMLLCFNLQMNDSRKKITLGIRKDEPMEKLMREFCRVTGSKLGSLKFSFDGETVDLSETPEALDLETDYCIDVVKL